MKFACMVDVGQASVSQNVKSSKVSRKLHCEQPLHCNLRFSLLQDSSLTTQVHMLIYQRHTLCTYAENLNG